MPFGAQTGDTRSIISGSAQTLKYSVFIGLFGLVLGAGVEPARLSAHAPQTCVSADSTTRAMESAVMISQERRRMQANRRHPPRASAAIRPAQLMLSKAWMAPPRRTATTAAPILRRKKSSLAPATKPARSIRALSSGARRRRTRSRSLRGPCGESDRAVTRRASRSKSQLAAGWRRASRRSGARPGG